LLLQPEDHVAIAHALVHLEADVVSGARDFHLLVLELDPIDALVEVGRVTAHVHGVADAQLAVLDQDAAGLRVRPEMCHRADALRLRGGDGASR
jgi:hypothetical protein